MDTKLDSAEKDRKNYSNYTIQVQKVRGMEDIRDPNRTSREENYNV